MSESEILEGIKQAESNAEAMVEQAHANARKAVADARVEAREIVDSAEVRARDHADQLVDTERKKVLADRQSIIDQGYADSEAMKDAASGRIDTAVDLLLVEFERAIHAKAEADE